MTADEQYQLISLWFLFFLFCLPLYNFRSSVSKHPSERLQNICCAHLAAKYQNSFRGIMYLEVRLSVCSRPCSFYESFCLFTKNLTNSLASGIQQSPLKSHRMARNVSLFQRQKLMPNIIIAAAAVSLPFTAYVVRTHLNSTKISLRATFLTCKTTCLRHQKKNADKKWHYDDCTTACRKSASQHFLAFYF